MKKLIIVSAVLVLIGVGYFIFINKEPNIQNQPDTTLIETTPVTVFMPYTTFDAPKNEGDASLEEIEDNVYFRVRYENNVFNPSSIEIRVGDSIFFENYGTTDIVIVSNPHPTHTSYPALNSNNIIPEENYSITFDSAVTVDYHNHLYPSATGVIIVR